MLLPVLAACLVAAVPFGSAESLSTPVGVCLRGMDCDSADKCTAEPFVVGPCRAAMPRWSYNVKSGACEEFVYGGCGGSANNFNSQKECEGECGSGPDPVPVCEQPSGVVGPCEAAIPRWTFNAKIGRCEQFTYGGCDGNKNNFESEKQCAEACPTVKPVPVCEQKPGVVGPCDAAIPRWTFNPDSKKCERFTWGGCGGNSNNFESEAACMEGCNVVSEDPCGLNIVPGPCKAFIPSWGFDRAKGKCVKFVYGGCGGNSNRFESEKACSKVCPNKPKDRCSLPITPGPCKASIPKWGFDSATGKCIQFTYGGCKGNRNRFNSQKRCEKVCSTPENICQLPIYPPEQQIFCRAAIPRWTYNSKKGACEQFSYGGCGGTANIFTTEKECLKSCQSVGDIRD